MNGCRDQGGSQVVPIGDGVIFIRLKSEVLTEAKVVEEV